MNILPVILCGGAGSRLWPLSRAALPKQLLPLTGPRSLLQETAARLPLFKPEPLSPLVICNEAHRFMTSAQLQELGIESRLVLEPVGRNTAPAVAMAALLCDSGTADETLLLVLPADHVIQNPAALASAVASGVSAAGSGSLITFGIVPASPQTGYGYIRAARGDGAVHAVEEFVEKPDMKTAQRYVQSGDYYWNSGMFLFSASAYLAELEAHAPDILACCRTALAGQDPKAEVIRPDADAFGACRAESIDYAVMEKTGRAAVVPLDAGWSDVGSWSALHDVSPSNADGNTEIGDVVSVDCRNSYIRGESRLVTAVGLDGCVVIETKDAIMVAPADRVQDVKRLVDELKNAGRSEVSLGREVFRPWGSYDSLENADGYQVKRLTVLPGAILSLQLHHRRAEHWVVVAGTARITLNDDVFDLQKNEHTFIPVEARHRIENPGTETLHIIEVQVGDYLGEDDIVRFEDKYGRQGRTD